MPILKNASTNASRMLYADWLNTPQARSMQKDRLEALEMLSEFTPFDAWVREEKPDRLAILARRSLENDLRRVVEQADLCLRCAAVD
jgi:hypothetical protein